MASGNSDPMGLVGSGTAQGAYAALRQLIADRLAEQARQRQILTQDRDFGLRSRQLDQGDALRRDQMELNRQTRADTLAEQTRQHDLTAAHQSEQDDTALSEQIPKGTFFEPTAPIVGRLQKRGMLTPQEERPRIDVGPLLPGDKGEAKKQGFLKLPTAKQIDTETDNDRQAKATAEQAARDAETGRHNRAMESKPSPLATVTIQTVDANGNPVTRVVPKSEAMGKDFAKAPNATTANRVASARAVNQTGADIIAQLEKPEVRNALGPALGRYTSLQEFVGNPPPEMAELAGQIESYALANMGVHGMRSAQGAERIKQLLTAKHTPESLAAAIHGLSQFANHFVENETPKQGGGRGGRVYYDADGNPIKK